MLHLVLINNYCLGSWNHHNSENYTLRWIHPFSFSFTFALRVRDRPKLKTNVFYGLTSDNNYYFSYSVSLLTPPCPSLTLLSIF